MRRWTLAAAALAAGAAASSGPLPWLHALAGAFLPPDFAQDLAAARVALAGQNPYTVGIAAEHARLMGAPPEVGYPFFPHPPLVVGLSAPFADLGLSQAALIWFAISLTLLFVLAAVLTDDIIDMGDVIRRRAARKRTVLLTFVALIAWPPVLYNLEKGQWSILVALLLALTWRFFRQSRPREAGACVGLAAAIKLFPLLLFAYLLIRSPRAVFWGTLVVVGLLVVPLVVTGPATIGAFLYQSRENLTYWETWPAVTYSVHAALARALIGGKWAEPFAQSVMAARVLEVFVFVFLVGVAVVVTGRRPADATHEGARYAAWVALLVVLNPLSMGHNGVILAVPIVLIGLALANEPRVWPRVCWLAGVVLVSLPRQLLAPNLPMTTSPWEGLAVIALPLWGALLLFIAAAGAGSVAPRREAAASPLLLVPFSNRWLREKTLEVAPWTSPQH
jgi:glycosyl transferase family 87